MSRPRRGCVPGEDAATLFAVLGRQHSTVETVAEDLRLPKTTAWRRLLNARDRGLVDFTEGKRGTLHACFHPVPFGASVRSDEGIK